MVLEGPTMKNNWTASQHLNGVPRLVDPDEADRAKRMLGNPRTRDKWLKKLTHSVSMHPTFTSEPPKGERSPAALLVALRALGAPDYCYVVASDSELDNSIQDLGIMIRDALERFGHGTILSCVPGRLALFRTAWPHKHFIVHRDDQGI
jgi:hypothetical protein